MQLMNDTFRFNSLSMRGSLSLVAEEIEEHESEDTVVMQVS